MRRLTVFLREEFGGGTAEFAIVLLPFSALIFAIIHLCLLFYANESLQFATESGARCYSVDSVNCGTPGAAQTYASGKYTGPTISPVFVATATGCGHTVTANGTYAFNAVVASFSVPLTATACFP